MCFAPIDFGHQRPDEALAAAGNDADRPTHFMCEGVTAYVPVGALGTTFSSLRSRAATSSTFAVDWAEERPRTDAIRRMALRIVSLGTALVGERIVTVVTRQGAEAILRDAGWVNVTTERAAGYPALLSVAHA